MIGAFSISLNVADIKKSYDFYVKLGFSQLGGNIEQNWVILKQGDAVIGLFQGMFEKNILTFNPGWDQSANEIDPFDDVRTIQQKLLDQGIALIKKADSTTSGPEYIELIDPDGNPILIDQHR